MAHPQSTPRGMVAHKRIDIGAQTLSDGATYLGFDAGISLSGQTDVITQTATYLKLPTGLALSAQTGAITQNASGLVLPTGLTLSGKAKYFTQDGTGSLIFPTVSALPTHRKVGGLVFVSNSTGKMLAFHSTGTTWLYASKTSVLA